MMPDVSGKQIAQYKLEKLLGAGAFGQVYLARKQSDQEQYAIKMISFESLQNSDGIVGQLLKEEINALATIDNPNVIKCIEYIQTKNNCYIVTEYCNSGDLDQLLKERGHFDEQMALDIMKQILNGLFGLHQKNFMHRDIKLPNILIHNQSIFKIADLGFCIQLKNQDDKDDLCLGSKGTMAPEVMMQETYGLSADIFSTGAIFYQLLFGQLPFNCYNDSIFLKQVKEQQINFQYNGIRISAQIQELIKKMLQYYPEDRITFKQLYQQQIFSSNGSMIRNQQVSRISKVTENLFDLMKTQHFYQNQDQQIFQVKATTFHTQDDQQKKSSNIMIKSIVNNSQVQVPSQVPSQVPQQVPSQLCQSKQKLKITEINQQNVQQMPESKIKYLVDQSSISPQYDQAALIQQKNAVVEKYYDRLNSQQYLIRTVEELNQLDLDSIILKEQVQFCSFIIYKKRKFELQRYCQILKDKVNLFNSNQLDAVIDQLKNEKLEDTLLNEINDMQETFDSQLDNLQNLKKRYSQHKWLSEFIKDIGPLFEDIYQEVIQVTIQDLKPLMKKNKKIACCIIHLQGCMDVKALLNRKINLNTEFENLVYESLDSIIAQIK